MHYITWPYPTWPHTTMQCIRLRTCMHTRIYALPRMPANIACAHTCTTEIQTLHAYIHSSHVIRTCMHALPARMHACCIHLLHKCKHYTQCTALPFMRAHITCKHLTCIIWITSQTLHAWTQYIHMCTHANINAHMHRYITNMHTMHYIEYMHSMHYMHACMRTCMHSMQTCMHAYMANEIECIHTCMHV